MPHAFRRRQLGVVAATTFGLLLAGTTAAAASPTTTATATSATTTDSPATPSTSSTSPDPGNPATTTSDPSDPTTTTPSDPTSTDPTSADPGTDPTITFTLPSATRRARSSFATRQRAWHARELHAVVSEVRRQLGKPYVYGAAGPRAFDCSGLVRYVFGHAVGRWLPHNAAAQYHAVEHIKRRDLEPGDLVFQESGGYPFHVGIYAGHDDWWHAPHSGAHVRKQRIYRGHLYYGRVLVYPGRRAHAKRARAHS